jgi:hypothetical protein
MSRTPTDLQILNTIHDRYYDEYVRFDEDSPSRSSKIFVPIDIEGIARELDVDPDIVFGRLYYHLEKRYGYEVEENVRLHFFTPRLGKDRNAIHFPYLSSVLSDLRSQNRKYVVATSMAGVALLISVVSFCISVLS